MRRFSVSNELDKLATRGKLMPRHIDSLAATIAEFHQSLPSVEAGSALGSPQTIHSTLRRVFNTLESLVRDGADAEKVTLLKHASEQEYEANEAYFTERHAKGFVRECHGDLHLGNIVLIGERPVPFDGIEFDPALRWIDVISEIAFTVMDLLHFKNPELAYRLLNGYLEDTGDYGGVRVLRFYLAHRATVRAMVTAIRASQPGLSDREREGALATCRNFTALANERLSQRNPALIIMHGLPGSGKTTLAQTALERLQAIRIRSDVERKRLFGLSRLADSRSYPGDIYSADATRLTFARLYELSEKLLGAGVRVIVDAAFLKQDERSHFRLLADQMRVPFVIASPQASAATLRARIVKRQAAANDASEADLVVLEKLRSHQEVLTLDERSVTVVFTDERNCFSADSAAWQKLNDLITERRRSNL
jgi:predicted kinase